MTLSQDIAKAYYATTASRAHRPTKEWYEVSASGWARRLRGWLPENPNARCLDLACGCGEVMYLLHSCGYSRVTGVDLCADELREARRFVVGELVEKDVLEYLKELPSESVDLVTALNFLEHLDRDTCRAVLAECRRVLAVGGSLVAMVPNAMSPFAGVTRHWDITHEWSFTPNNFRQLAALTQFAPDVEFRECGPVPHGLVSGARYVLWQALRLAVAGWLLIEVSDTRGTIYTMDMMVRLHRD
jgi:SAM-dependent methyltransferase